MGLVIGVGIAALVWLAMWRARVIRGAALQLLGAALLVGLAGYTLQGRSDLRGSPAAERPPTRLPPVMPVELAAEFYERFNAASPWIILANGYMERGESADAVETLRSALRSSPRDSELWLALGNALVIHNEGRLSAAAELAFQRSASLAPGRPGPRFFYGLMLLGQGQGERGLALWKKVLRSAPADATWRPGLAEKINVVEQVLRARTADRARG